MDIHRSRFVPYPPSTINALAFSHASDTKSEVEGVRLAVGRANGDIEIWNPARGAWNHETTFHGGKDRSVEGLQWIQEPSEEQDGGDDANARQLRLFSIGYSSSVTEWSLATGLPLRHSSGNSSEVWCIATQPKWTGRADGSSGYDGEWKGQNIAAGCADGTTAVLSTADNDLQWQRYLTRPTQKRARCLSITYQNRDIVVAGYADSTIRVLDSRNGTLVRTISFGAGPVGGPREILVWSVKCLPNGDIVSGDSTGDVRFFDGKYFSQTQRVAGHEADVLALAVSADGESVFSAGPDRRTVVYELGPTSGKSKRRWWAKSSHQRHHTHDVKDLASFESKCLSVLASGGVDTELRFHPIRGQGDEYTRAISGLPQYPPVLSTRNRLLVSWWEKDVWVWQIQSGVPRSEPHKLLTKIALKGEAYITSVSVSDDCSLLAVATAAEVRVFDIRLKGVQPQQTLRIRKIPLPKTLESQGARLIRLSHNSKWLAVVRHDNTVHAYRLSHDDNSSPRYRLVSVPQNLIRSRRKRHLHSALGPYERTVTRVQFSNDDHVLVLSDLSGHIDVWVLAGHEDVTAPETETSGHANSSTSDDDDDDSDDDEGEHTINFGQYWTHSPVAHLIPRLDSAPLILSFRPTQSPDGAAEPNGNPAVHPTRHNPHPMSHELPKGPYFLVVLTARHHLFEFDLLSGKMTRWSRRNLPSSLPPAFTGIKDRAIGCMWHVTQRWDRLWLYGRNWVFMFDLSQNLDAASDGTSPAGKAKLSKKRKRGGDGKSGAGDRVRQSELHGFGRKIRRTEGAKSDDPRAGYSDFQSAAARADGEDSEDDGLLHNGVGKYRRGVPAASDSDDAEENRVACKEGPASSWYTFKYRPILGIVPLSSEVQKGSDDEAQDEVLEVVLIERPSWDLDLPPRFMGVHEREG